AVTTIHSALDVAFQAHPAATVTVTVAAPTSLANVPAAGEIANEHTGVGSIGDSASPQLMNTTEHPATTTSEVKPVLHILHLNRRTCCRKSGSRFTGSMSQVDLDERHATLTSIALGRAF